MEWRTRQRKAGRDVATESQAKIWRASGKTQENQTKAVKKGGWRQKTIKPSGIAKEGNGETEAGQKITRKEGAGGSELGDENRKT